MSDELQEERNKLRVRVENMSQSAMHQVSERAFYAEKPCVLHKYHAPEPVMTEGHHIHPVFLQNRLYGKIQDNILKYLCSNCHDAVHAWLYWLLGERREPPKVGRFAKEEAQRTYDWFIAERDKLLGTNSVLS